MVEPTTLRDPQENYAGAEGTAGRHPPASTEGPIIMSISAVSSGGGYTPQVARTAPAPKPQAPAASQAPTDADGDHDGTTAAAGKVDLKL